MEIEFLQRYMDYKREEEHIIIYKGIILKHKFFADFTLHDQIIVEVKANKDRITPEAIAQTLNYSKVSCIKLALIINFGKTSLEHKRLVY